MLQRGYQYYDESAIQVKEPIQNYFEKVLYENLTFEIPPLWVLELHCQSRDGKKSQHY